MDAETFELCMELVTGLSDSVIAVVDADLAALLLKEVEGLLLETLLDRGT